MSTYLEMLKGTRFAIVCLVVYSFGFPAFLANRVFVYRKEMIEDRTYVLMISGLRGMRTLMLMVCCGKFDLF